MLENYEAIAHTYSLVLLFLRAKVDPFLHLVQDGKLQAVNPGSVGASKAYGSKEDDEYALKALSQIKIAEEHARESFATIIVKSLENLSESETSILWEQLVLEFVPEDVCPLAAQMLVDATRLDFKSNESPEEAAVISATDDDTFLDLYDSQTKHDLQLSVQNPNLLGINQLLESVLETAHEVGRFCLNCSGCVLQGNDRSL